MSLIGRIPFNYTRCVGFGPLSAICDYKDICNAKQALNTFNLQLLIPSETLIRSINSRLAVCTVLLLAHLKNVLKIFSRYSLLKKPTHNDCFIFSDSRLRRFVNCTNSSWAYSKKLSDDWLVDFNYLFNYTIYYVICHQKHDPFYNNLTFLTIT